MRRIINLGEHNICGIHLSHIDYNETYLFMLTFLLGAVFSNVNDINLEEFKEMGYNFGIMFQIMDDFDKINPINAEDIKLLSNLRSTFDLGTKTIIGRDEDEIIDDLSDLMTE